MGELLSHLTVLLRDRKQAVLQQWMERMRADPQMPLARKLEESELRDYVPMLIDELVDSLAASTKEGQPTGASGPQIGGGQVAKEHVRHRFAHGYTLTEELRELAHVRAAIVDLCARENVVLEGEEGQLVHSAIDEVMITAAVEMEQLNEAALRKDIALRELFIAILGHDLRNPLSAITFAAATLLRRDDVPAALGKVHRRISACADRMRRLIDDLLDMSRIRAGQGLPLERAPSDLHAIFRQVIDELELTHPDRVFEVKFEGDGHGNWNPSRMGQLLSNLVGNALDYSPFPTPVRITVWEQDSAVVLKVNNQGAPIPPEAVATIFDPFRRGEQSTEVARRTQGLGLGLFIVREIARAHGGSVQVTSNATEGTTFTVKLPRTA